MAAKSFEFVYIPPLSCLSNKRHETQTQASGFASSILFDHYCLLWFWAWVESSLLRQSQISSGRRATTSEKQLEKKSRQRIVLLLNSFIMGCLPALLAVGNKFSCSFFIEVSADGLLGTLLRNCSHRTGFGPQPPVTGRAKKAKQNKYRVNVRARSIKHVPRLE